MFTLAPTFTTQVYKWRRLRTWGDSRATQKIAGAPDMYDGAGRTVRSSTSNQPSHHSSIPFFLKNAVIVADGGVSGSECVGWSGARSDGKSKTAVFAVPADDTLYQFGTNDVQNHVTDVASVTTYGNTIIAALQADLLDSLKRKGPHERIWWETIIQRDAALGYLNTNAANKRDCVDYVNTTMLAWIAGLNNPFLRALDLRALTNIGGVTSGDYAITPGILGDGIHCGHKGAMTVAQYIATQLAIPLPDQGVQPMWRGVGPNLFQSISAGPVINTATLNGTVNTFTFGTNSRGNPRVTVEFTPTADNTGRTVVEFRANVGSNGAGGPAANLVAAGDKLAFRALISLDDGAGGTAPASSISAYLFFAYIGGPALQQVQNGNISDTTARGVPAGALSEMVVLTNPVTITNGSADIAAGANAGGVGFRVQFYLYGLTNGAKVRMYIDEAELRKVA